VFLLSFEMPLERRLAVERPSSGLRPPSPHLRSDGEKALEFSELPSID
jgi:hypothetical protein